MSAPLKLASGFALLLTVTSCGLGVESGSDVGDTAVSTVPEATASGQGSPRITVSRVKHYESLHELAADVDVVARVKVLQGTSRETPADREGRDPSPATVVTIDVIDLVKGALTGPVAVRTVTSPDPKSEVPPPLVEGRDYVLFLDRFEWERGKPTGEWVISGGAGIYQVQSDGTLVRKSRGPDVITYQIESLSVLRGLIE